MKSEQFFSFITFVFFQQFVNSFIIPDEVLSLYPFLTSKIPRIKIGTDSKFGYGFDLGRHASYQTVIELGPQTNIEPFDNEIVNSTTVVAETVVRKRFIANNSSPDLILDTNGGKWLARFRALYKPQSPTTTTNTNPIGVIDARLAIPETTHNNIS